MPAGASWPRYFGAVIGAMLSMFAGAQTVHIVYQPLRDLSDRVEVEKQKLRTTNLHSTVSDNTSGSPSHAMKPS